MKQPLLVLALATTACDSSETGAATPESMSPGPLVVATVNYPLAYFAERIGGDAVRVTFPAPADGDPAFWSPAPETIVLYQDADLILLNGAGYAKWAQRASLPASRAVDTSAVASERYLALDEVSHTHGPEGAHSHGTTAFTTWLDPTLAVEQARAIAAAFSAAVPERSADFEAALSALETELLVLDERWRALVARDPEKPLLGSHPVYQYLATRTAMNLVSVHWEPDALPDDDAWRELEALLESHAAQWMLWEGEPLPETAERLRSLGVACVVFDPCGNAPAPGDFASVMEANSTALQRVFD